MPKTKILFDPKFGYDRQRITDLESSHLKKLIAILVRKGENFECEQMSGGKWILKVNKYSLSTADVAKVTGSVEEE